MKADCREALLILVNPPVVCVSYLSSCRRNLLAGAGPDVSITANSVTIKGQTSREEKEERGEYYRCEMSRGAPSASSGVRPRSFRIGDWSCITVAVGARCWSAFPLGSGSGRRSELRKAGSGRSQLRRRARG
jgi:predicted small secreted protein